MGVGMDEENVTMNKVFLSLGRLCTYRPMQTQ